MIRYSDIRAPFLVRRGPLPPSMIDLRILSVGLFAMIYTWGIEVPIEDVAGIPLWLAVTPLCLGIYLARRKLIAAGALAGVSIFAAILLHQLLVKIFIPEIPIVRTLISGPFLGITIGLMYYCIIDSRDRVIIALIWATKAFIIIQFGVMIAEMLFDFRFILGGEKIYYHYFLPIARPTGMFAEPSHVATAMVVPVILLVVYPKQWWRNFGAGYSLLVFGILLVCPSATLLACFGIAIVLKGLLSGRSALILWAVSAAALTQVPALALANREYNPIAERLADTYDGLAGRVSGDSLNLSSLVLTKAVYVTKRTLEEYPLGVGYDNAAFANSLYARDYTTYFYNQNAQDLGTMLAKATVEFGILGFMIIIGLMSSLILFVVRNRTSDSAVWALIAVGQLLVSITRSSGYYQQGLTFAFAAALVVLTLLWRRYRLGD